ncbi:hypothetical protein LCGC14_2105960 [marine sediment metagenome]|uniref:Uncharacterized protein n=1 Tax=marine sediment metagenome TaxID=412755 RepID=A0A0F9E8I2_9ZZZZ
MKIIKTAHFEILAKKKDWDPNPWAICNSKINKDEEPEKFERCIMHVKEKQEG